MRLIMGGKVMIMKSLSKLRTWVFAKPLRGAVVIFWLYIPASLVLRLIGRVDNFVARFWIEVIYSVVFGFFTATIVFVYTAHNRKY